MAIHRIQLVALALLLATPVAAAAAPHRGAGASRTAKLDPPAQRTPAGRSVGSPTEGRLIGGAHLAESSHLRVVPTYAAGDARWALEPLVGLIDHAARSIRKQYPDAVLSVGHLSRPGGGEIDRHASHESGRDADVGFYVKNHLGKPIYADHFVAFKPDGTAPTWPGAQFDDARNWAFVAAAASDARARVSHIFVASPLRTRLLQYAEKIGAPATIRTRAAELMAQPKGALPHDDHFHVRIACPPGMDKCIEQPLARKRPHGSAGHAHATLRGGAKPQLGASAGRGASSTPEPVTPKAAPPRPSRDEEAEASKSESLIPSLAPMVPGLDSAVIAAPLGGTLPPSPAEKPADVPVAPPPPSDVAPIDDPDGILERH